MLIVQEIIVYNETLIKYTYRRKVIKNVHRI